MYFLSINTRFWTALYSLSLIVASMQQSAAETLPTPTPQQPSSISSTATTSNEEKTVPDFIDATHGSITRSFEETIRAIDLFFAEEKAYRSATGSYAQISLSSVSDETGGLQYTGTVNFKINLPKTSEKLKLLIESNPKTTLESDKKPLYQTPQKAAEASKYYSSLQSEISKTDRWEVNGSLGVEISTPLDPFVRTSFKYTNLLGDWKYRFEEILFWFNSEGGGHSTVFEFDRQLDVDWLFRTTTSSVWKHINGYADLSEELAFFQRLSYERSLSYQFLVVGNDQNHFLHATEYRAGIRYRQQFYKKWLFAEVLPEVRYLETNAFAPTRSLTLTLEMVFDSKYL